MKRKYIVLKIDEVKKLLTPEEQDTFTTLMSRLTLERAKLNIPVPHYFTLNMTEMFALPAVENYIQEIDNNEQHRGDAGVRDARAAAWQAREWAINNTNGDKKPT